VIDALPFLLKPIYATLPENLVDNRRGDLSSGVDANTRCQIPVDILFSSEPAFFITGGALHLAVYCYHSPYHFQEKETCKSRMVEYCCGDRTGHLL